jgi:hypothetical protein
VKLRLWYPQLDVYDAVRRLICLLGEWTNDSLSPERMYIADFFIANPPLLHRTHFPQALRRQFQLLGVPRPDATFVSYPSAPILFHTMEHIQKDAFKTIIGKGLVDTESLATSRVRLSESGRALFRERITALITRDEASLIRFVVAAFATIGQEDIAELRKSTGLRRAAP